MGGAPASVCQDVWLSGDSASTDALYPAEAGGAITVKDPSGLAVVEIAGMLSNRIRVAGPRFAPVMFTVVLPCESVVPWIVEMEGAG